MRQHRMALEQLPAGQSICPKQKPDVHESGEKRTIRSLIVQHVKQPFLCVAMPAHVQSKSLISTVTGQLLQWTISVRTLVIYHHYLSVHEYLCV